MIRDQCLLLIKGFCSTIGVRQAFQTRKQNEISGITSNTNSPKAVLQAAPDSNIFLFSFILFKKNERNWIRVASAATAHSQRVPSQTSDGSDADDNSDARVPNELSKAAIFE